MDAILVLENGEVFKGTSFGASGTAEGEVCFNTSMTGYQEIITDPSYKGQIVAMTYPHIGNYGINNEDIENSSPQVRGLIAREVEYNPSNWRSAESLPNYFKKNNIIGIENIDTRKLTKILRVDGSMRGLITTELSKEQAIRQVKNIPSMIGSDYVKEISSDTNWSEYNNHYKKINHKTKWSPKSVLNNFDSNFALDDINRIKKLKIVAYDFGIKWNILRLLQSYGSEIILVKSTTSAEEVLAMKPDGIFLSNGPGDPATLDYISTEIKKLIGKLPIFAICLGHQLICKSLGAKTFKLKFGHRGANQPVKDLKSGKVFITSQNHGFAVDPDSLNNDINVSQINLNDETIEAIAHRNYPILSVQYHPEASPGPNDAAFYFNDFFELIIRL